MTALTSGGMFDVIRYKLWHHGVDVLTLRPVPHETSMVFRLTQSN